MRREGVVTVTVRERNSSPQPWPLLPWPSLSELYKHRGLGADFPAGGALSAGVQGSIKDPVFVFDLLPSLDPNETTTRDTAVRY